MLAVTSCIQCLFNQLIDNKLNLHKILEPADFNNANLRSGTPIQ